MLWTRIAGWIASKSIILVIVICAALAVAVWTCDHNATECDEAVVKWNWWEKQAGYFEDQRDSIADRWVKDTTRLHLQLADARAINSDLSRAQTEAINKAYVYEAQVNSAITQSDNTTDRLDKAQKELAYTRALLKNKTLAPADSAAGAGSEAVTTAGLKTTERERVLAEEATGLRTSVGTLTAQNDDLKTREERATKSSLYAESRLNKIAARKTFKEWLRRTRKREAAEAAEAVRLKRETGVAPDELQP